MGGDIHIDIDDLTSDDVIALLQFHLEEAHKYSPPESVHALDLTGLKAPDMTFWTARDNSGALMGCAALKQHETTLGEIKSMRTAPGFLRRGVAAALMTHLMSEARARGLTRLSLETGSMDSYAPARALYERFGFAVCPPFADYWDDPLSVCMTREI